MVRRMHHPPSRGFTLIELLIVIFIISIVTAVAMLSVHVNDNKRMQAVANEIAETITLAEEEAILQPAVLGMSLHGQAMQFMLYQPTAKEKWVVVQNDDGGLKTHTFPADIKLNIVSSGKMPQVIISNNGAITPFSIYIGKQSAEARFIVRGESDGNVIVESSAQ